MLILPWVWIYLYKEAEYGKDQTKSHVTCNGAPRFFAPNTIGEMYPACLEQPTPRLIWEISAALGLMYKGYDVDNAFAEVQASNFNFFLRPDAQFKKRWRECLKREPLKPNKIIPIHHAIQGHSESPRL